MEKWEDLDWVDGCFGGESEIVWEMRDAREVEIQSRKS